MGMGKMWWEEKNGTNPKKKKNKKGKTFYKRDVAVSREDGCHKYKK